VAEAVGGTDTVSVGGSALGFGRVAVAGTTRVAVGGRRSVTGVTDGRLFWAGAGVAAPRGVLVLTAGVTGAVTVAAGTNTGFSRVLVCTVGVNTGTASLRGNVLLMISAAAASSTRPTTAQISGDPAAATDMDTAADVISGPGIAGA
jgi:hypothetical protein